MKIYDVSITLKTVSSTIAISKAIIIKDKHNHTLVVDGIRSLIKEAMDNYEVTSGCSGAFISGFRSYIEGQCITVMENSLLRKGNVSMYHSTVLDAEAPRPKDNSFYTRIQLSTVSCNAEVKLLDALDLRKTVSPSPTFQKGNN